MSGVVTEGEKLEIGGGMNVRCCAHLLEGELLCVRG